MQNSKQSMQDGGPLGGIAIFIGTLVTLGVLAFLVGTADVRLDSMFETAPQTPSMQMAGAR